MKICNAPHGYQWQAGEGTLGHTGNISDN